MPPLPNPRHEIIATQVATGKSWEESMLLAGYAKSTARKQMQRMSANVGIQRRISELRTRVAERIEMDATRVLRLLVELVEIKISDFDKPREEWTEAMERWACEQEDVSERSHDGVQAGDSKSWDKVGVRIKITNRDKLKALEMIGRHKAVDAFVKQGPDAKEVAGEILSEIDKRIAEGRQRAAEVRKIHATDK